MPLPEVVSHADWQAAHEVLLAKEKAATRASDALAAERRRQPVVKIDKDYAFEGPNGPASLVELFDGRSQLVLYHFMFAAGVHGWPQAGCPGCTSFASNVGNVEQLHAKDTSFALVSLAPIADIERLRGRMGWEYPWYSSAGSDFNRDFGVTRDGHETFALTVFVRDGDEVYQSYRTQGRGVEALGTSWTLLDITPYGRQQEWEDSPAGWPQGPTYG